MKKIEGKKEKKDEEKKKLPVLRTLQDEQIEIKKLNSEEDVENAFKLLKKSGFEVTKKEIEQIVKEGVSFGAYVSRILIAVGLGWKAYLNPKKVSISDGEPNAVYLEDVVVSLQYEGRGIRSMLIKAREKEALANKFLYSMAYISGDLPEGGIEDYIKERGGKLAKEYLLRGYEFHKTKDGTLAVKVF
ncbi:GNAT family N-acetyltransferase [Candidatus Micrarchaeota archaeon]|nr:GNAT family N-acetyltransferase [Candidatus Micrarchaeota archaeon]